MRTIERNFKQGAEYVPCPFDGTNFNHEWLEDFLYDGHCVHSGSDTHIIGYATFDAVEDITTEVYYHDNVATWSFPHLENLTDRDVDWFMDALDEYLKAGSDEYAEYAFKCTMHELEGDGQEYDDYKSEIRVRFFAKVEQ